MNKSLFIVFEGCDGSGKSSIIKLVDQYLTNKNINHIVTREPGGNNVQVSEKIRAMLLDDENTHISKETEAYLFAASRSQHVNELIIPCLKNNQQVVICDRFILSSLAYQGYVRNLGIQNVYNLNQLAIKNVKVDLTIYLDVNYQVGLDRIKMNNRNQNRLDKDLSLHQQVALGYQKAIEQYPEFNCKIVDANQPLDIVYNQVIKLIDELINN